MYIIIITLRIFFMGKEGISHEMYRLGDFIENIKIINRDLKLVVVIMG